MRLRASAVIGAFVLGCLLTSFLSGRPSVGQAQQPVPTAPVRIVGRYQMTLAGGSGSPYYLVVMDSATGRCWSRPATNNDDDQTEWSVYGSPEDPKK
jgi:hypothetical protein